VKTNFHKIQNSLQQYRPGADSSLASRVFNENEYMLTWSINSFCNFDCPYCGLYKTEHPSTGKYSSEHIKKCFDDTGKSWHIIITGGEPFLYPDFTRLVKLLTENHYISLNSNLSNRHVQEFAETIDPEHVILINAGMHPEYRDSSKSGLNDFIKHYKVLEEKGFNIVASLVVYPTLLSKLPQMIEEYHKMGISQICAKSFSGNFQGKKYPESYTKEEIAQMSKFMTGQVDMIEYLKYTNFSGNLCQAGSRFFAMDPAGNMVRCLSDNEPCGNLFEGTIRYSEDIKKCRQKECVCPYQGMLFSSKRMSFYDKIIKLIKK
jgi:MoaA/NifB/PqqE/SkfB family radical SAM enzyme